MVDFQPGDVIEVGNTGKGWEGSWYAAIVLQKSDRPSRSVSKTSKQVFVEYCTLMADKQGLKRLRKNVNLSRVRPKPPTQDEADRVFRVDEKVEVFDNDGWWEGIVSKVLGNQRYGVYFKESDLEIEYEKSKLRKHFEWVDEKWVCEALAQEQQTMVLMFSKGDLVEVCIEGERCGDTWFPATVLKQTSNNRFLVELQTSCDNTFQLLETVDAQHIRPRPPQMSYVNIFQLSEKVDVLYDWKWWSGVISRVHMDWVDGKWYRDSKEISVTPHVEAQAESSDHAQSGQAGNTDQNIVLASQISLDAATETTPERVQSRQDEPTFENTDMDNSTGDACKNLEEVCLSSIQQTLEPSFTRGRLVEVCLDGNTCYGTWFPATVLQETDNNSFLVKFQQLRSRGRPRRSTETVESRYIRPFPPQTSDVQSYQQLDKVDAYYDGGWRNGIIKRILPGGQCTVFFEQQNKLKDFSPSKLRVHMDWTEGNWSKNSKEISGTQHHQCGTESRRHTPLNEAVNTEQIIDLTSPLSLDASKDVAAKSLSVPAQQDRKDFQNTDMGHQSSGNAVKHVMSKKLHSSRISKKLDYQLSSKKEGSPGKAHSVDTVKEKGCLEKSPTCLSGEAVRAQMSLIACPILRGIAEGTFSSAQDQRKHDLESNRPRSLPLAEGCSSHLQLSSSQDQRKHDLESNRPRSLPLAEGCSSHLHLNSGQDQDAASSIIRTMARQVQTPRQKRKPLGGDDIEQHEIERLSKQKMNACYMRRQARENVSSTKASVKGPEHAAANRETSTSFVQAEDTLKEIEMDEESSKDRDSDQHISMCMEECYFTSTIAENVSSANNQPLAQAFKAIIWEDEPMTGPELQNPPVIGTNVAYEAIVDECDMQSFLISDDDIPIEDEELPFIKCSPVWETVESTEAFRAIPQQPHFHPLEQFPLDLREGLAIGLTLSFISIVEKVSKATLDDPLIVHQNRFKALEHLKANGFNVQPIQTRLEELKKLKEKQEQLNSQLVEAEEKVNEQQHEKDMVETEMQEVHTEMRKMEERLNELKKKWDSIQMKNENQGSKIAELKNIVNTIREWIQCAELKFNTVAAAPW